DAARLDLEHRRQGLDSGFELLDRVLAGALAQDCQGVVDDLLGDGLLAVEHDLVDDLLDEPVAMNRVWLDRPDLCCCATGHQAGTLTWPSRRTASEPSYGRRRRRRRACRGSPCSGSQAGP